MKIRVILLLIRGGLGFSAGQGNATFVRASNGEAESGGGTGAVGGGAAQATGRGVQGRARELAAGGRPREVRGQARLRRSLSLRRLRGAEHRLCRLPRPLVARAPQVDG